ncbi:hypothetical protein [Ferrimonas senticii]|uniref:hypothetical protein n=1 Tax=Ferrimonas senticii TaxID=394566 RepID=UPI000409911D|nr:hypothetical protein [Ferrimonas senticii]
MNALKSLLLLTVSLSATAYASDYPNFYKNVDKRSNYKNALQKDDWYMPTAQQRALVKGILSHDLIEWGLQWKVQQIIYDPNFYQGIRLLGAETGCLLYRHLRGYLQRPRCFAEANSEQAEAKPFVAPASQFYQQPLIINSPAEASADDDLRYEFWVPAGIDYAPSRHYYPIHRLGLDAGVSSQDNMLITAFVTVYQNDDGQWRKLKLSNSPITLVLKLPTEAQIKAKKNPQQAYRYADHRVRILDFRE